MTETSVGQAATEYARGHHVLILATAGIPGIWAAPVYYVFFPPYLLFATDPRTRHGESIGEGAQIAGVITEDYDDWTKNQGLQLRGWCQPIPADLAASAETAYCTRFPVARSFLAKPDTHHRLYGFLPEEAWMVDNRRGFGRHPVPLPFS